MLVATSNKADRLLLLSYVGHIRLEGLTRQRDNVKALIAELSPGFRVLADFTNLETMDHDCAPEIGRMMEVVDQAGVSMVIRVMPDSSKDVGMNILTRFHYRQAPRIVTCETFAQALKALEG